MLFPVRRIVTTNDMDGKSRVLSDSVSTHVLQSGPDRGLTNLWITDVPVPSNLGINDAADRKVVLEPPESGTVFRFFQVAPASPTDAFTREQQEAAAAKAFALMRASHLQVDISRHPAMHKSRTLDYIVLLQGKVRLILDHGEVDLQPFDAVVQRGTNHAWVNLTDKPALLMGVLMDAADMAV